MTRFAIRVPILIVRDNKGHLVCTHWIEVEDTESIVKVGRDTAMLIFQDLSR